MEKGLKIVKVKTSDEMLKAVKKNLPVDVAVLHGSSFRLQTFGLPKK